MLKNISKKFARKTPQDKDMAEESSHMTVGQYYKKKSVTAVPTDSVEDVLKVMVKNNAASAVIVKSKDNPKVVGIVSLQDVVEKLVPDYLEVDSNLASFQSADMLGVELNKLRNKPVKKIMTSKVVTVKTTDSISKATILMAAKVVRQLPVVDEKGVSIGYISRGVVQKAILDLLS